MVSLLEQKTDRLCLKLTTMFRSQKEKLSLAPSPCNSKINIWSYLGPTSVAHVIGKAKSCCVEHLPLVPILKAQKSNFFTGFKGPFL